ncbi:MAG TPA: zf-TFIIB domain-containing protein [Archangium sp.]|nr:zf-TFIIB domain-containing protein [Archangium sp.]
MTPDSKCPGCTQVLQPFLVPTPSGAELELRRCTHCGGFWGAAGRIQDTFGPSARHQLIGGTTARNCVECRILMTPAMLPSDIAVEVCSACRGIFLDAGELARLGVRENSRAPAQSGLPRPPSTPRPAAPPPVPVRTAPPPPPPSRLVPEAPGPGEASEPPAQPVETAGTFECTECGKRKPLREGQALRDGLACRACMKARQEGRDSEDFSLGSLFRGRPKS